jgi:hypothetical protein
MSMVVCREASALKQGLLVVTLRAHFFLKRDLLQAVLVAVLAWLLEPVALATEVTLHL